MRWKQELLKIICASLMVAPVFADNNHNQCIAEFKSHIITADTAWFDDCELTDKHIPIIISYLNEHPEITQLYLLNNKVSDDGAIMLAKNKTLKLLELRNNLIDQQGVKALAQSSIHMIDLQGNKVDHVHLLAMNKHSFSSKKIQRPNEVIILV